MQELNGIDKRYYYELKYLEHLNKIILWKGVIGEDGLVMNFHQKYLIDVIRKPKSIELNCSCPSGTYRGYCKHIDFAKSFNFNKIVKPKDTFKQFAEEYYSEWIINNSK